MISNYIYDYLEGNYRVIPLWGVVNGECQCGDPECKAAGKHPRISIWQQSPHWSDEQIETMDERLTTVEAHKTMNLLNIDKFKKRGIVDTISAVYILEKYMKI